MTEPTATALALASHIIRLEEGFVSKPYWDSYAHCWSVGFGQCTYADGTVVGQHTRALTPTEGEAELQRKLRADYVAPALRLLAGIELTDGQAAALFSFVWNGGPGALTNFGIPVCLRRGDARGAIAGMRRLNTSRGKVVPVLVARRQREALVFAGGPYRPAPASPSMAEIEAALTGKPTSTPTRTVLVEQHPAAVPMQQQETDADRLNRTWPQPS